MIRGVLFDLDLTLIDSRRGIWLNFCRLAQALGLDEPSFEAVSQSIGKPLDEAMTSFFGQSPQEWLSLYRQIFSQSGYEGVELLPGARQALAQLRERGLKLAIATNRVAPEEICDRLDLTGVVDGVFGTAHVPHKPEPELLWMACEALGLEAKDCLYVGDTALDIEAARRAGMASVAVATGLCDEEALRALGADYVLASVAQLPGLVEDLS